MKPERRGSEQCADHHAAANHHERKRTAPKRRGPLEPRLALAHCTSTTHSRCGPKITSCRSRGRGYRIEIFILRSLSVSNRARKLFRFFLRDSKPEWRY
jgi:hypothetical protein